MYHEYCGVVRDNGKDKSKNKKNGPQAKLMGKRTDEVAKMVVDHYNLPMQPEEWIERSRWGEFSYIARNKTSVILTMIIIEIVQQSR